MNVMQIDSRIDVATSIPSSFYTSSVWFEEAKEKIFAKTWQLCTTQDEVRISGQLFPHTLLPGLLDEPILFVRDENDKLHCLSNVCTHRGNLLIESPCISQQIKCRYHGRRFNLNGNFLHMPEFEQAKNFPSDKDNLTHIPFDHLGPFIFVSLLPTISFAELKKDILQRIGWLPLHELRYDPHRSRDYLVKAHWALYCENYLEGLHIPFVHKSLRNVIDYASYSTQLFEYANLQTAYANAGEDAFDLPQEAIDYGKPIAAYYYWIFPNTMLNFYPWGCSVNIVKPISPSLTKVSFLTFILDETRMDKGAGAELDKVEREDEAVVETVQKGIRSRFYDSGRYSPTQEKGPHHFHRLVCKFLNA